MAKDVVTVLPAQECDAPLIGKVVVMAVGVELSLSFFAKEDKSKTVADVEAFFGHLAAMPNSQYSYRNTLKAVDAQGNAMGFLVCYDGGKLAELREAFFRLAKEELNLFLTAADVADETIPGELYVDSLGVFPAYRGRGVAQALLRSAIVKAGTCGLRLGLIVEKENHPARALYESVGFRQVGETPFAGVLMDHMVVPDKEKIFDN